MTQNENRPHTGPAGRRDGGKGGGGKDVQRRRNLLFFCTRGRQFADFQEMSRRIRARAPDIAPFVFTTRAAVRPLLAAPWLGLRPTVSIEMDGRKHRPRVIRGTRFGHSGFGGKVNEYKRIEAQGLPLPKWTEIVPETSLDPAEWGPYVVVKPSRGARGAFVRIFKTGRVRFRPCSEYPEDHPGRRGPMLAQRFVYSGPWPVSYRVLTYFGVPVSACRYEGRHDMAPLEGADGIKKAGGGLSIVAPARGCTITLADDPDILDLARRTHAAFPEIPSLGIDIVRDRQTGKLYLMELNSAGDSWLFSNDAGLEIQAQFGFDFYTQFNALDLIADRSIEIARERAY